MYRRDVVGGFRTVGGMRWIVDGMNVIGSRPDGWWKDRRRAMDKLVADLEHWADDGGRRVMVVFEAPVTPPIESTVIEVGHAPRAAPNSADAEIARLVRADRRPEEVVVVTSDSALAEQVRDAGAAVEPSARFRELIDPRR